MYTAAEPHFIADRDALAFGVPCAQLAPSETVDEPLIVRAERRVAEQRFADHLDSHPRLRIGLKRLAVSLDPERRRRGDLRRGGRSSGAVETHYLSAAELCPWHVRHRCRDRGAHLAGRPVVAGHTSETEISIGRVIGHHTTSGHHAIETGGERDVAGWQIAEIVAGGGDDEHALLIQRVTAFAQACEATPPMLMLIISTKVVGWVLRSCT
jgi:hypothetical protein